MKPVSRYASTTGINPAAVPKAPKVKAAKATVPFKGDAGRQPQPAESSNSDRVSDQTNGLNPSLDMSAWDKDPLEVYRHMTGKELKADDHTRMVQ